MTAPADHFIGTTAAVGTAMSWAICVFPFTAASNRLGAAALNHLRLLMAVAMLTLLIVIIYHDFRALFGLPQPEQWLWMGASGVLGLALGDYFAFRAFSLVGPRLTTVFNTISPGAALLVGLFLLGETVNGVGLAGMAITLAGVVWIILEQPQKAAPVVQGVIRRRGILFAVLSALCQGTGLALAKKGMDVAAAHPLHPVHVAWIRMVVATGTLYIVTTISGRWKTVHAPIFQNSGKAIGYAFLGSLFGPVLGVSLSMAATAHIQVSVAQTIFSLVPVLVLLITFATRQEKITVRSILASLLAVAGVVILVWRDTLPF